MTLGYIFYFRTSYMNKKSAKQTLDNLSKMILFDYQST